MEDDLVRLKMQLLRMRLDRSQRDQLRQSAIRTGVARFGVLRQWTALLMTKLGHGSLLDMLALQSLQIQQVAMRQVLQVQPSGCHHCSYEASPAAIISKDRSEVPIAFAEKSVVPNHSLQRRLRSKVQSVAVQTETETISTGQDQTIEHRQEHKFSDNSGAMKTPWPALNSVRLTDVRPQKPSRREIRRRMRMAMFKVWIAMIFLRPVRHASRKRKSANVMADAEREIQVIIKRSAKFQKSVSIIESLSKDAVDLLAKDTRFLPFRNTQKQQQVKFASAISGMQEALREVYRSLQGDN
ncbi:hypothetical protein BC831DRAFT_483004 [Entophlyctis helioformis]|nr:hypothetical protein BC831DRAFT_483004 [Entophlyctis helioformis]